MELVLRLDIDLKENAPGIFIDLSQRVYNKQTINFLLHVLGYQPKILYIAVIYRYCFEIRKIYSMNNVSSKSQCFHILSVHFPFLTEYDTVYFMCFILQTIAY